MPLLLLIDGKTDKQTTDCFIRLFSAHYAGTVNNNNNHNDGDNLSLFTSVLTAEIIPEQY